MEYNWDRNFILQRVITQLILWVYTIYKHFSTQKYWIKSKIRQVSCLAMLNKAL